MVKVGNQFLAKFASPRAGRRLRLLVPAALTAVVLTILTVLADSSERIVDAADIWLVENGLAVTRVTVTGTKRLSDQAVRHALGEVTQHSVLRFDVNDAKARLEALGWVRRAEITRRLPGSLHVDIVERKPFALWQTRGRMFLIDRDGNIIQPDPGVKFADLPLITGVAGNLAAAGILDALAAVPDLEAQTRAAVRVAARRWNLEMNNGVVVKLPQDHYVSALLALAQLELKLGLLKRELTSIDLRAAGQMTLRLTPDAAARRNFLVNRGGRRPSGRHAI